MKILNESLLSAADMAYAVRFITLFVTPWEKTSAYKEGLIDKNGKRIKSEKLDTKARKEAYTIFHRLVYNIKRLVGNTKFTSFASALYLIKEHSGLTDDTLCEILADGVSDELQYEITEAWYDKETGLDKGRYTLVNSIASPITGEVIAHKNTVVEAATHTPAVGSVKGINLYEVKHINTNQTIIVALGDIKK